MRVRRCQWRGSTCERFLMRARGNRGGNALGARTPFRPARPAAFGTWEGWVRVVKIAVEVPAQGPPPAAAASGLASELGAVLSGEIGYIIGPEQ